MQDQSAPTETGHLPGNHIQTQAARNIVVMAATTLIKYGLALVRMATLARLLSPEAFGLMGIATALLKGFESLAAIGPERYLVQKKVIDTATVSAVWILRLGVSGVVCVAVLACAKPYAHAVGSPAAIPVISIIALGALLRGFRSPGAMLAEREIRFSKVATFEIAVALVEFAVVVTLTQLVGGEKSLAIGLVMTTAMEVVLSHVLFRTTLRLAWDGKAMREVLHVGKHFFVIALGSYLMLQGDNMIVGAVLGPALLGQYLAAYRICELPLQFSLQVTNRVALSTFSRMQTDDGQRKAAFVTAFSLQVAILIPMAAAIIVLAHPLVLTLYGPGWEPAIPALQGLGLLTLGRGLSQIVAPYLIANGHFAFAARNKIFETGTFLLCVWFGCARYSLLGAGLGAAIGYLCAALVRVIYLDRVEHLSIRSQLEPLVAAIATTAPPAAVAWACTRLLDAPPSVRLLCGTSILVGLYGMLIVTFRPTLSRTIRNSGLNLVRRRPSGKGREASVVP